MTGLRGCRIREPAHSVVTIDPVLRALCHIEKIIEYPIRVGRDKGISQGLIASRNSTAEGA